MFGCASPSQGVSGRRPSSSQLINALQQHDLFLYFGHGGGEQYVPLAALKRLDRCAGSLLMGCSSGRLKQAGVFEPSGAIWGYLTAGEQGDKVDGVKPEQPRICQHLVRDLAEHAICSTFRGFVSATDSLACVCLQVVQQQ